MTAFVLDPVIDNDTITLGDLPLCRVQLLNDARYPWLLLLPRIPRRRRRARAGWCLGTTWCGRGWRGRHRRP